MNRTTTATAVAILGTTALCGGAKAAPAPQFPTYDPLGVTVTVGEEQSQGQRTWEVSVDGDFVQPDYSEDGLVDLEVDDSDEYDQLTGAPELGGPSLMGEQKDDGDGIALRGCPETDQLAASPAGMSSDDKSFTWITEGGLEDPSGHYEDRDTRLLEDRVRALSVSTLTCVPDSQVKEYFTLRSSQTYFLRTGENSFVKIGSSTMPLTPNEGSGPTWFAEPGWEFLEHLQGQVRPDGLSDAEWADEMVAEGVVPADKRWYVANEEPPAGELPGDEPKPKPEEPGPIVDTGVTTDATGPAVAAGLAGLALLGAGATTVAASRRR